MLRGRPNIRRTVKEMIMDSLTNANAPITTSTLTKNLSQKLDKKISWNTVQKYIQELVEAEKVTPIRLPHSKKENKDGLTVYTLKK